MMPELGIRNLELGMDVSMFSVSMIAHVEVIVRKST
jgi:hypothetical protein